MERETAKRLATARVQAEIDETGTGAMARTVTALSEVFPYPAYLFETGGTLRWMSDEGAMRLGLVAARLGSSRLVKRSSGLEALTAFAAAVLEGPRRDAGALLRPCGVLRAGERVTLRRFGEDTPSLLLLAVTPGMVELPGRRGEADGATLASLGTMESRVARLAADGYTVLNIAMQLGVSEGTVRTHLHRVYVKLGVHGRAELATILSRGRA